MCRYIWKNSECAILFSMLFFFLVFPERWRHGCFLLIDVDVDGHNYCVSLWCCSTGPFPCCVVKNKIAISLHEVHPWHRAHNIARCVRWWKISIIMHHRSNWLSRVNNQQIQHAAQESICRIALAWALQPSIVVLRERGKMWRRGRRLQAETYVDLLISTMNAKLSIFPFDLAI